jgi:hypothetical protein
MRYLSVLFFLLTIGATALNANAAPLLFASHSIHTVADTDTVYKKRSISVGTSYGSDIQFFGRTGPIKYPFISTDAIYNFKSGIFVYASGFKVLGYNPLIDEIDLGTGYLFNYTKKFSGIISYTHFFFNKDAADVIKSASTNNVDFKNTFDWKFAKSSVTLDYLFGKANDYFVTINTSKYIETSWGIFDDKDYLSFNPTISAILGTQNFVGRFSTEHLMQFDLDAVHRPTGIADAPNYNNGRFNALNYSIKLPIAYNRPHYTFEASWKYSVPVNVEDLLKNRHELFFNLTFYYIFY